MAVRPALFVLLFVMCHCPKRQKEPLAAPTCRCVQTVSVSVLGSTYLPKNSGTKKFYMMPFMCTVAGAHTDTSQINANYAVHLRRSRNPAR